MFKMINDVFKWLHRANSLCVFWPENGRQAGRGAPRVQVTQGPRHPSGPSHRQTGRAGRKGRHVRRGPFPGPLVVFRERTDQMGSATAKFNRFGFIELGIVPMTIPSPHSKMNFLSFLIKAFCLTFRPDSTAGKGKTLAARVHIWSKDIFVEGTVLIFFYFLCFFVCFVFFKLWFLCNVCTLQLYVASVFPLFIFVLPNMDCVPFHALLLHFVFFLLLYIPVTAW